MAFKDFDVFVIGTGTAGKNVAKECAAAGRTVGIADNREYGGTCANVGCDPKKVLLGISEILEKSQKMLGKGIKDLPTTSWADLMEFKETFVNAVPAVTEKNLKKLGIHMYHQSPKFLDENTLSVEGKTITARKIVIATGQVPMELPIPGRELALISDDFLNLNELPESMIFIGAGYIGMEFAHLAARMGVKVTMMDFAPRPLMNFDEDIVNYLVKASEEMGIKFLFNAKATGIEKLRKNFRVTANNDGKDISATAAMVFNTAGRVPSIEDLDLEKGNVAFSKDGVSVNQYLQNPTNKNVYACGDVSDSGGLALTPLSALESQVVAANILKEKSRKVVYPPQPSVVFTLPNLASVGLSEKEAKDQDLDFTVEHKSVPEWFNARRINEKVYAYKTLVDNKTGVILGAHLIGPEAGEVINLFSMALYAKIDHQSLKEMIFAYPTWGNDIKGMV
ncbi:MAG: NAD(P)/FAD-dependent oxidoreductase [Gillisia sp.]